RKVATGRAFGVRNASPIPKPEVNRVNKRWKVMFDLIHDGYVRCDKDLVALAREGNKEAFGELIQRHYNVCVKLAAFILRDHGEAQDEVQKACCKAYQHLDQYQGEAEFLTWLLRIVVNQCLMLIRVRKRTRFLYIDEDSERDRCVPIELPALV